MMIVTALLFGLLIGSFLNVCIERLPRGRSLSKPASHCPRCKEPIRFYDNIPIISFLLLRGKCRSCGEPISWRYPLVELMNGLLYVWTVREFQAGGEAYLMMVFSFIAPDSHLSPSVITSPAMLLALRRALLFMYPLRVPRPFPLGGLVP